MSTTQPRKPTHRIFAVTPMKNSDKGFFHEIGAAWAHRDSKGFNCRFTLFPTGMAEADIVILEIDEAAEEARRNRGAIEATAAETADYGEPLPN